MGANMSQYEIKPTKTTFNIRVGDMSIVYRPYGAGTDMVMSQSRSREEFLNKRVAALEKNAKTVDDFAVIERDIDELNSLQSKAMVVVRGMFSSDSEETTAWLDSLGYTELLQLMTDIAEQMNESNNGKSTEANA